MAEDIAVVTLLLTEKSHSSMCHLITKQVEFVSFCIEFQAAASTPNYVTQQFINWLLLIASSRNLLLRAN